MKFIEYVKFGFGFYVGYEVGKKLTEVVKEVYPVIKERFKKGYC